MITLSIFHNCNEVFKTEFDLISGLIGQQTGSGGRHRNGRRRAVTLAANRIDSTSSDEFDGNNDAKVSILSTF